MLNNPKLDINRIYFQNDYNEIECNIKTLSMSMEDLSFENDTTYIIRVRPTILAPYKTYFTILYFSGKE